MKHRQVTYMKVFFFLFFLTCPALRDNQNTAVLMEKCGHTKSEYDAETKSSVTSF